MRYRVILWIDELQWSSYRTTRPYHAASMAESARLAGIIQCWCVYEIRESVNRAGCTESELIELEKSPGFDDSREYPF